MPFIGISLGWLERIILGTDLLSPENQDTIGADRLNC